MALEIERRFLVSGQQWRSVVSWQRDFAQGYLPNSSQAMTSRVRLAGVDEAWLTLKFPAGGIARQEFEYAIPSADASALLERCEAQLIKRRFGLELPGGDWVLDVFAGENAPWCWPKSNWSGPIRPWRSRIGACGRSPGWANSAMRPWQAIPGPAGARRSGPPGWSTAELP